MRAVNHPTNTTTMVVPFATTSAGWLWISPVHPGSLTEGVGRGRCSRVIYNFIFWLRKNIYCYSGFTLVLLFYCIIAPKMALYPPHDHPRSKILSISPPPHLSFFGCLLCGPLSVCSHLRPHRNLLLFYFWHSIRRPKRWEYHPPRAQTPVHLLSQTPLTTSNNFRLIVVCCRLKWQFEAKTPPISFVSMWLNSLALTKKQYVAKGSPTPQVTDTDP